MIWVTLGRCFDLPKHKSDSITLLLNAFNVGLPDLSNKNTGHPAKFEIQINNEYVFEYNYDP